MQHITITIIPSPGIDKLSPWYYCQCSTKHVHVMTSNDKKNGVLIKFSSPLDLKQNLQTLADERNITLSSLLRLIASEYVKRNRGT